MIFRKSIQQKARKTINVSILASIHFNQFFKWLVKMSWSLKQDDLKIFVRHFRGVTRTPQTFKMESFGTIVNSSLF